MAEKNTRGNERKNRSVYYLFASPVAAPDQSSASVFYSVEGERLAQSLIALFTKEYGGLKGEFAFHNIAAASIPAPDQVLLDEALQWLEVYSEPDIGVYDPQPSKDIIIRAQYAVRASTWEDLLRTKTESTESPIKSALEKATAETNAQAGGTEPASTPPQPREQPQPDPVADDELFELLCVRSWLGNDAQIKPVIEYLRIAERLFHEQVIGIEFTGTFNENELRLAAVAIFCARLGVESVNASVFGDYAEWVDIEDVIRGLRQFNGVMLEHPILSHNFERVINQAVSEHWFEREYVQVGRGASKQRIRILPLGTRSLRKWEQKMTDRQAQATRRAQRTEGKGSEATMSQDLSLQSKAPMMILRSPIGSETGNGGQDVTGGGDAPVVSGGKCAPVQSNPVPVAGEPSTAPPPGNPAHGEAVSKFCFSPPIYATFKPSQPLASQGAIPYMPPAHSMAREVIGRLNEEFEKPMGLGRPPELMASKTRRFMPFHKTDAEIGPAWEIYKVCLSLFLSDYADRLDKIQRTIRDSCPEPHAKLFKATAGRFWKAGRVVATCQGIPSDRILHRFTSPFSDFHHEVCYLAEHLGADVWMEQIKAQTSGAKAPSVTLWDALHYPFNPGLQDRKTANTYPLDQNDIGVLPQLDSLRIDEIITVKRCWPDHEKHGGVLDGLFYSWLRDALLGLGVETAESMTIQTAIGWLKAKHPAMTPSPTGAAVGGGTVTPAEGKQVGSGVTIHSAAQVIQEFNEDYSEMTTAEVEEGAKKRVKFWQQDRHKLPAVPCLGVTQHHRSKKVYVPDVLIAWLQTVEEVLDPKFWKEIRTKLEKKLEPALKSPSAKK